MLFRSKNANNLSKQYSYSTITSQSLLDEEDSTIPQELKKEIRKLQGEIDIKELNIRNLTKLNHDYMNHNFHMKGSIENLKRQLKEKDDEIARRDNELFTLKEKLQQINCNINDNSRKQIETNDRSTNVTVGKDSNEKDKNDISVENGKIDQIIIEIGRAHV